MVNDKDTEGVVSLLPKDAIYYFTQPSNQRAMGAETISLIGESHNLNGKVFSSVKEAYINALSSADNEDTIYVGGSTFVVADLLEYLESI